MNQELLVVMPHEFDVTLRFQLRVRDENTTDGYTDEGSTHVLLDIDLATPPPLSLQHIPPLLAHSKEPSKAIRLPDNSPSRRIVYAQFTNQLDGLKSRRGILTIETAVGQDRILFSLYSAEGFKLNSSS